MRYIWPNFTADPSLRGNFLLNSTRFAFSFADAAVVQTAAASPVGSIVGRQALPDGIATGGS
jgi:hypothetical protein